MLAPPWLPWWWAHGMDTGPDLAVALPPHRPAPPRPLRAHVYSIPPPTSMLEEMEEEVDGALTGMAVATKRTQEFIQKHGGMQWCCVILVLSAIAGFLFLLILFSS